MLAMLMWHTPSYMTGRQCGEDAGLRRVVRSCASTTHLTSCNMVMFFSDIASEKVELGGARVVMVLILKIYSHNTYNLPSHSTQTQRSKLDLIQASNIDKFPYYISQSNTTLEHNHTQHHATLRSIITAHYLFVIPLTSLQPSLTIGNVGQLAVDLLISTLALPRIGFLEDDHVVPMAGNDTFSTNQGKLSCAIEGIKAIQHSKQHEYFD